MKLAYGPRCRLAALCSALLAACVQLAPATCRAELPPPAPANVEPSAEAREQFNIGVSLLQDPDGARYEEAFKAFLRAYTATPSWKILGNLGLSALKIERYTDGIEAYERYLAQAADQLDPAELEQVKRDLNVMKATSGSVVLSVSGATRLSIEDTRTRSVGGPVVNVYEVPPSGQLKLRLASGHHALRASGEGKVGSLEIDVKSGESSEHSIEVKAPAQPAPVGVLGPAPARPESTPVEAHAASPAHSSSLRSAGLIIGGVGVAGLVGGGVTFLLGTNARSDLESRCPENRCEYSSTEEKQSLESDRDSLETMGTLTTMLLIGGGVLAAGGATLFVIGGSSATETQVSASPCLAPGVVGFSARGAF